MTVSFQFWSSKTLCCLYFTDKFISLFLPRPKCSHITMEDNKIVLVRLKKWRKGSATYVQCLEKELWIVSYCTVFIFSFFQSSCNNHLHLVHSKSWLSLYSTDNCILTMKLIPRYFSMSFKKKFENILQQRRGGQKIRLKNNFWGLLILNQICQVDIFSLILLVHESITTEFQKITKNENNKHIITNQIRTVSRL